MPSTTERALALGLFACLAIPAAAFWRMPCPGRVALERIDPIISPGAVSGHVHTVSGASGFGFTTSYDQLRSSACSSCPVKQDLSAYWTPKLYYMGSANGAYFEDVPQAGEANGATGGLTVYYEQRGTNLTAFPEGFRMIAGDPFQRNQTNLLAAPGQAVSFVCLDYNGVSTQSLYMPNKNCPDGLRAQVYFPSCWNGVDLDPPDHKSHMAYPIQHYDNGDCPTSHPVRLISIFFEVIYQTGNFADRWWSPKHHPFVFAQGDRGGFGFHGDFFNGWDTNALQLAIDTCTANSGALTDCPVFADMFTPAENQGCRIPPSINEPITGKLTKLPGCNPVTNGPGYAAPPPCNNPLIGSPAVSYTDEISTLGWSYQGCANDSLSTRTFQGASWFSDSMTIEGCIGYCKSKGYSLAGLEYASQCYCDNTYYDATDGPRQPNPNFLGSCVMPCAANSSEICGGPNALSVYKNCQGGACTNAQFVLNGTINSVPVVGSAPAVSSVLKVASSLTKVTSSATKVASSVSKVASSASKITSGVAKVTSSVAKVTSSATKSASSMTKVVSSVAKATGSVSKATSSASKVTSSASKVTSSASKAASSVPKVASSASKVASSVPKVARFLHD